MKDSIKNLFDNEILNRLSEKVRETFVFRSMRDSSAKNLISNETIVIQRQRGQMRKSATNKRTKTGAESKMLTSCDIRFQI